MFFRSRFRQLTIRYTRWSKKVNIFLRKGLNSDLRALVRRLFDHKTKFYKYAQKHIVFSLKWFKRAKLELKMTNNE